MSMSGDSKYATYVKWVKNYTHRTNKVNKRVTIHHQAGSSTPEALANMFNGSRQASSNYGISVKGEISQMVRESDQAWTSGGQATKYVPYPGKGGQNDGMAVTIEVANCKGAPNWEISQATYDALVLLCADICIRNNIVPSYTGDIRGTFTEHKMFAATACPGPTIHNYLVSGKLISDIKAKMQELGSEVKEEVPVQDTKPVSGTMYKIQLGAYSRKGNADKQIEKLKSKGISAIIVQEGNLYKVQIDGMTDKHTANAYLQVVKSKGFKDAIIKEY